MHERKLGWASELMFKYLHVAIAYYLNFDNFVISGILNFIVSLSMLNFLNKKQRLSSLDNTTISNIRHGHRLF